jgi:predicted nucleic acid-binding protein
MILVDTNILSTLAKVGKLDLLFRLFTQEKIGIVPSVYEEIQIGIEKGYDILQSILDFVKQGHIHLVPLSEEELIAKASLPRSFDEGEREVGAVAKQRQWTILTNENLVKNWCQREKIPCIDLSTLLRALWRTGIMLKEEVAVLINEIENKDRLVFKNKEQILTDNPE